MKWVPLSLIRVKGQPNMVIIFSSINLVANSLVHDSIGYVSTAFSTYSTIVIMYLALVLSPRLGKVPIKYMD